MGRAWCALILAAVLLAGCAERPLATPVASAMATPELSPSPTPSASASVSPSPAPTATPEPVETLIATGDIAGCDVETDSQVAALIAELDGTVATLGDHVYPDGNDLTFEQCYDPAWGPLRDRTRPSVGNHDLSGDGGAAYWRYFGTDAGVPGEGWYSYDVGAWHVVALNSNCELIPCGPGSPQHDWLTDDLAASAARCTLAYMHHPRFSSGPHGDYPPVAPLWDALHAADADLLLAGHDHMYERFAPQTPAGTAAADGIRQFTVGTGGYVLYAAQRVAPNSELLIDDAHGVLELTLHPDSYDWSFIGVDGVALDEGSADCH